MVAQQAPQNVQIRQAPEENANRMERWQSVTKSICIVKRVGEFGKVFSERITPGKVFHILPSERRMNQHECAMPGGDLFSNGMLMPLELVEGEDDNEALLSNPNLVQSADVSRIFKLKGAAFRDRLADVTSVATLRSLKEKAEEPRTQATVSQLRAIEERLGDVDTEVLHIKKSVNEALHRGEPGPSGESDEFKPIRLGR